MKLVRAAAVALVLAGCASPGWAPRAQVTEADLPRTYDARYDSFVRRYTAGRALDVDEDLVEQARRVFERIKSVVVAEYPQARGYDWKVHVPVYPERVPQSFGSARLILPTAYFDTFRPNDDEVAAAIGHEIAHDLLGHYDLAAMELAGGRDDAQNQRWRQHEIDADILGMRLAVKAGYRAEAAVSQLQRLISVIPYDAADPAFARLPPHEARIQALQDAIARLP